MADDKKTDNTSTKEKVAPTSNAKKVPAKKKNTSKKVEAPTVKGSAATAKAAASKESDMKAAAKTINELDERFAATGGKANKPSDDLKARAHEAKQRAQQKILDKAYVSDKPTDPLERLANTFDSSARRWEMVVYPSLFAFVLLAGYGFFLIYRLTHDISILSQSVTHMAVIVSDSMPRMTKDLNSMTGSIDTMNGNINGMTTEIVSMSGQMDSLTPMSDNIKSMTHNIGGMNRSVYGMQRDMHGMNKTVSSGPFGMMNDMMPFSSNTNVPPPVSPAPVWPAYVNPPQGAYANRRPYYRPAPVQAANGAKKAKAGDSKKKMTAPAVKPVSLKLQKKPETAPQGK